MTYEEKQVNFQIRKIERNLILRGFDFVFEKQSFNKFKEKRNDIESTVTIRGLFHFAVRYLQETTTEGTKLVQKNIPMILCLSDENSVLIQYEYELSYNGKRYVVTDKTNIDDRNYAFDISLEEIQSFQQRGVNNV